MHMVVTDTPGLSTELDAHEGFVAFGYYNITGKLDLFQVLAIHSQNFQQ